MQTWLNIPLFAAVLLAPVPAGADQPTPAALKVPGESRTPHIPTDYEVCTAEMDQTSLACLRPGPAEYAVGEAVPEDVEFRAYYVGVDLPRLDDIRRYWRTDEYIYVVDTETQIILDIVEIGSVILH